MKTLEAFFIEYHTSSGDMEDLSEQITLLLKEGYPVKLIGKDQKLKPFWIIQLSDAFSLTDDDLSLIQQLLSKMIFSTDRIIYIVVIDMHKEIQGVIAPENLEGLEAYLKHSRGAGSTQFSGGTDTTASKLPPVKIFVWVCPAHPEAPPFMTYHKETPIPPCPIGNEARVLKSSGTIPIPIIHDRVEQKYHDLFIGAGAARLYEFYNPLFSAFWPRLVQANKSYVLMVFVHIESAMEQVREIARGHADAMGGQVVSSGVRAKVEVPGGTTLTFVPQFTELDFTPHEQILIWQAGADKLQYQSATFLFKTPTGLASDITGRILVFSGPLIYGEIPVLMQFSPFQDSSMAGSVGEMNKFDPVFASYSHRDAPVMEYFRKMRQTLGQRMLVDIYDLRVGEHWVDRLLEMIDESAVFQLFWSRNSAVSEYCRKEWEYAYEHKKFIHPVYWQNPIHELPPELKPLHCQRISLPPVTRFRLLLHQFRYLRRG